ncbi:EpsG family protein [Flavobacterium ginsenosidimutans]|uniref:EpsG family protein n=1 Tax=Flavobacterium ginsenosidimutans TaxID=687844 RepID=A0ABZ2Q881_9FLAO|nr:EpsG family protein [Flavobacterium ginsenosidimutans]KAF2334164.1 EpsG family protein [Flavobacterium ginsenosidimutans]
MLGIKRTISIQEKLLYFTISLVYAFWLAGLPSEIFRDRNNYEVYATDYDMLLELYISTYTIFAREPVFLYFNKWLSVFNDPITTIQIFVFFICFSLSFFILKTSRNFVIAVLFFLFMFFNAQAFAIQLVTLRQGIGLGFLLWYILYVKKYNYLNLVKFTAILGFIHTSFLIVAFLLFVDWFVLNKTKYKSFNFRLFFLATISIFINLLLFAITKLIGAKQDYSDFEFSSGGGAFILWFTVFVYILVFKPKTYELTKDKYMHALTISGLVIYLTSYFLTPIAGRIIGTYLPFVFYILMYRPKLQDIIFIITVIFVFIILFVNGGAEGFMTVSLGTLLREMF